MWFHEAEPSDQVGQFSLMFLHLSSAVEQGSLCHVDNWELDGCIFLLGFCYGFSWDVYLHWCYLHPLLYTNDTTCSGPCCCAKEKKCLYLFRSFHSIMEVGGRIWQNVTLFCQNLLPYSGSSMIRGSFMASLWVVCVNFSPPLPWTYIDPLKTLVLGLRQLYNQKEGLNWSTIHFYQCEWIKLLYKWQHRKWLCFFFINFSGLWISDDSHLQE